jgi:hypothetical protein
MFGNSTVSAKNMFAVLMGGWKGASLAAADYMRIEGAIIAQRNAGIMGNPGKAVMAGHYYTYNSKLKRYQDPATGRIISSKEALSRTHLPHGVVVDTSAAGATRWAMTGKVSRAASRYGAKGAVSMGARVLGKGMLGIGRGLLGFLGGPVGLAITGLTILPSVVSAIRSNKEAEEENTAALEAQRRAIENNRAEKQLTDEMRILIRALNHWAGVLSGRPVNVNVSGSGYNTVTIDNEDVTLDTGTK